MQVFDNKIWNNCEGYNYGDVNTTIKAGTYNSTTNTWTNGNSNYSLVRRGNTIFVEGTIPYESADTPLGLAAGNRFYVKLSNQAITSKSDLPEGIIAKITNTQVAGGYNTYTKDAFEDDGSLIVVTNVSKTVLLENIIKWKDGETTYTFDFSNANFQNANI